MLCLEKPPQHADMDIQLRNKGRELPGYLSWLSKSAIRAEKLKITTLDPQPSSRETPLTYMRHEYNDTVGPRCCFFLPKEYPLLPKRSLHGLLTRLSTCSPKLRKLAIICPRNQIVYDDPESSGVRLSVAGVHLAPLGRVLAADETGGASPPECGICPCQPFWLWTRISFILSTSPGFLQRNGSAGKAPLPALTLVCFGLLEYEILFEGFENLSCRRQIRVRLNGHTWSQRSSQRISRPV